MTLREFRTEGFDISREVRGCFTVKVEIEQKLKKGLKGNREDMRASSRRKSLSCGGMSTVILRAGRHTSSCTQREKGWETPQRAFILRYHRGWS